MPQGTPEDRKALRRTLKLLDEFGPTIAEDPSHYWDEERQTWMITFTILHVTERGAETVTWDRPVQNALAYFQGKIDGCYWLTQIQQMASENAQKN